MTDLIVVLLPIPTVWRVKLPFQQQLILVMLFAVGFLITLVGVVRTYYLYKVDKDWDKTWEAYPVWLTSSLELYVGVVSSLLTLYLHATPILTCSCLSDLRIDPSHKEILQSIRSQMA